MNKPWLVLKESTYVEIINPYNIPLNIIEATKWFFTNNKVEYCWQVGNYLITLLKDNLDKDTVVTIKAFYKSDKNWLSSNLNNTNFLKDIWLSFWTQEWLGEYWYSVMEESHGSCDWDLTDTPITVDTLFKALYEFTNWGTELDKDREASEWEKIHE